ncbi:MAG: GNAT family N-acetyltransferase [Crenarchaeota archaeon]|nr:MAG: GNAT family N-acetyltransferase [Thermoproteota archaeon]
MNLTIRKAKARDIPAICNIIAQLTPGVPHDYHEAIAKFENKIQNNPDYFLWVVTVELTLSLKTGLFSYMANYKSQEIVVATAMMHLQHKLSYNCGTAAHLEDLVVDKDWRGKGIGSVLVNNAIAVAQVANAYKIMLTCFPKTIPYYLQFGFEEHDVGMRLSLKEEYPKEN